MHHTHDSSHQVTRYTQIENHTSPTQGVMALTACWCHYKGDEQRTTPGQRQQPSTLHCCTLLAAP
jgi:hypothetical protein